MKSWLGLHPGTVILVFLWVLRLRRVLCLFHFIDVPAIFFGSARYSFESWLGLHLGTDILGFRRPVPTLDSHVPGPAIFGSSSRFLPSSPGLVSTSWNCHLGLSLGTSAPGTVIWVTFLRFLHSDGWVPSKRTLSHSTSLKSRNLDGNRTPHLRRTVAML